jgi:predicted transposase/invertase (TIGR01784 family)
MPIKPARFLDPKSDVVFKKIFGQHPDLIKSLLNSILPLPEERLIEKLEYLSSEQTPSIPTMKNTIVDVKCTDQYGRVFIVEMQMQWTESFSKRLLFGASKAFVQQLNKGEDYNSLCPVYGVGIINDIFDKESEDWFHHYRSINVQKPERVLEGLELIFIELPKFKAQSWQEKKMGVLWLRFLREIGEKTQDIDVEFLNQPELSKALELSQESAYSKAELEAYDKYWDAVSTQKTYFVDGFEQGIEKGIEKGLAEGMEKKSIEIVLKMIAENIPVEMIIKLTNLSVEEIKKLSQQS